MKLASQVILGLAVLAAVAGGVFLLVRQSSPGGSFEIVLPTATPAPNAELKVYISGAVRHPGVYAVADGGRVSDVLDAAGGATEDADLAAVNLAVRVKDQDHWDIPRLGDLPQAPPVQKAGQPGQAGKININTADLELLKSLPGIGDVRAKLIISYREAHGPFASVEDLLKVRGIGRATLAALRDLVEVR